MSEKLLNIVCDSSIGGIYYSAVKKNGTPKFKSNSIDSRGFQLWSTAMSHTSIESLLFKDSNKVLFTFLVSR